MYADNIPSLKIGNLEISPPIIQGGMGVRVSKANLASAAANAGCAGIIASAVLLQAGYSASEAIHLVSWARGGLIPDTEEQKTWIESLALYGNEARKNHNNQQVQVRDDFTN